MDPLAFSIIAAALSVWAGGPHITSLGKAGQGVMVVLAVVLLAIAFVALAGRAIATW